MKKINWYVIIVNKERILTTTNAYTAHKRWAEETWKNNACEVKVV